MTEIALDLSPYDYHADMLTFNGDLDAWARQCRTEGKTLAIFGSQWPPYAETMMDAWQRAGNRILGSYAEPDAPSAIAASKKRDARYVGLACERGSILTYAELLRDVDMVLQAGLVPWLYGNKGDLIAIAQDLLERIRIWLANYGTNDPRDPREPITEMDFGQYGVRKLAAHQFNSTIVVAGRNRDHSYVYLTEEEPMTPAERKELDDMKLAMMSGNEDPDSRETRLANANYRIAQRVGDAEDGTTAESLGSAIIGAQQASAEPKIRGIIAQVLGKAGG